jgi:hypothetical protein
MATLGWVGVDLDGTLATYEHWTPGVIGEPVPIMLERVKRWRSLGMQVRIVTARAADPDEVHAIRAWCVKHLGEALPVTDRKDYAMVALWDDRAVAVESNTGLVIKREWPKEFGG